MMQVEGCFLFSGFLLFPAAGLNGSRECARLSPVGGAVYKSVAFFSFITPKTFRILHFSVSFFTKVCYSKGTVISSIGQYTRQFPFSPTVQERLVIGMTE